MRFRLLASGDNHWCKRIRFAECVRVHQWMTGIASELKVDAFLDGGDIYEEESGIEEREAVDEWLLSMADVAPVLIARGNHDRPADLLGHARLRTRHPIIIEERANVHWIGPAAVATVAWPDRSEFLARLASAELADDAVITALRDVLRGLGDVLAAHDGPRILLGHFMVDGSKTSTGQPLLGQPIRVGLEDLALACAHLGLMSHVHAFQQWDIAGAPHLYIGSPFRTDFGQLEKKYVTFAEFDGARLVHLEQIETPATPMMHLDGNYVARALASFGEEEVEVDRILLWDRDPQVRGAEVRVRYAVPAHERAAAKQAEEGLRRELSERGASAITIEAEVIAERRARAPEVGRATTLADKVSAHWASIQYDPERRDELLRKTAQLEEEVRRAA